MYITIKIIHVLTAVLLFGVGLSNFIYFMLNYHHSNLRLVQKNLQLTAFIYCWVMGVAGFFQPITGFALIYLKDYPLSYIWWVLVLFSYALASLCWLLGLYYLLKMQEWLDRAVLNNSALTKPYFRSAYYCMALSVLAFLLLVMEYILMAALVN